jgi:hypothetical protein
MSFLATKIYLEERGTAKEALMETLKWTGLPMFILSLTMVLFHDLAYGLIQLGRIFEKQKDGNYKYTGKGREDIKELIF